MNTSEQSELIAEAGKLLGLLLEEAVELLKNFDTFTPDDFEKAIRRREDILDRFYAVDGRIALQRDRMAAGELGKYEAYRQSKEAVIKKILEADSVVTALAGEQLSVIKDALAALTKGKRALHAYEGGATAQSRSLNDSV